MVPQVGRRRKMARPTFTSLARWSTYSERLPLRVREITSYAPVIALEAPICLPHAATGPSFGVPLVMAQERGTMLLPTSPPTHATAASRTGRRLPSLPGQFRTNFHDQLWPLTWVFVRYFSPLLDPPQKN